MRVIPAGFEITEMPTREEALKKIEKVARTCYKSENCIKEGSDIRLVKSLIDRGHEAMLEHVSFTIKFICDRGVSHELVRHRMASYAQESTRYCNYSKDKFGKELTFIKPCFWENERNIKDDEMRTTLLCSNKYEIWLKSMYLVEMAYMTLLKYGATPEQARSILPNSVKTELVMTMNLREWRHFLKLRTAPAAHPQMRELTIPLLRYVKYRLPEFFNDIKEEMK